MMTTIAIQVPGGITITITTPAGTGEAAPTVSTGPERAQEAHERRSDVAVPSAAVAAPMRTPRGFRGLSPEAREAMLAENRALLGGGDGPDEPDLGDPYEVDPDVADPDESDLGDPYEVDPDAVEARAGRGKQLTVAEARAFLRGAPAGAPAGPPLQDAIYRRLRGTGTPEPTPREGFAPPFRGPPAR